MENILDWKERFRAIYKPLLKNNYDEFEQALTAKKFKHFRINLSRNIDYFTELNSKLNMEKLQSFENVYKVLDEGSENLTISATFQTGGIYIMNPSSVVPAKILSNLVGNGKVLLDVSAAPGGKTCALSDYTSRSGLIVANELSSNRLKSLHFNLEKNGCYDVKTISMDGRLLYKSFANSFDGVLLDAPCSNENKIFRDKTVQSLWGKDFVERMATLQKQLILSSFDCLKEGGTLVYSTCTLSIEENEHIIKFLLENRDEAELIDVNEGFGKGFSGDDCIDEKVARIMPSMSSIDGFFVAAIKKVGEVSEAGEYRSNLSQSQISFINENFADFPTNVNVNEQEGRGYIETACNALPNMRFKRRGLNFYKITPKYYELSAQSLWQFGSIINSSLKAEIGYDDVQKYLKGFDIECNLKYSEKFLFYKGIPIGTFKHVDSVLKNKLDRYFLYGKNIEW